jgi:hypothetical protein
MVHSSTKEELNRRWTLINADKAGFLFVFGLLFFCLS